MLNLDANNNGVLQDKPVLNNWLLVLIDIFVSIITQASSAQAKKNFLQLFHCVILDYYHLDIN